MMDTFDPIEQTYFALAFLANVDANDVKFPDTKWPYTGSKHKLEDDAHEQLTTALGPNSPCGLSDWTLEWGPAVVLDPSLGVNLDGGTPFAVANLAYVAKNKDTYYVGVSGTNPISWYGWNKEDFDVSGKTDWSSDKTQGQISNGAATGLGNLLGAFSDRYSIVGDLQTYLNGLAKTSTNTIVVGGHSLGGCMAPLVALSVYESQKTSPATVIGRAYAGPSPGDSDFFKHFQNTVTAKNSKFSFQAFNNALDLVPHAWDTICGSETIYQNNNTAYTICQYNSTTPTTSGEINADGSNELIKGFIYWAAQTAGSNDYKSLASASNDPTLAWSITPYALDLDKSSDTTGLCFDLYGLVHEMINPGSDTPIIIPLIYNNLNTIYQTITGKTDNVTGDTIMTFMNFMAEAGMQHVRAYASALLNPTYADAVLDIINANGSATGMAYWDKIYTGIVFYQFTNLVAQNVTKTDPCS